MLMPASLLRHIASAALACALGSSAAQAALSINISHHSTGFTLWEFSGSSNYLQASPGGKISGSTLDTIIEWKGSAAASDYVPASSYNNYTVALQSGSISVSVTPSGGSATTDFVDGLHVDHDNTGDDFGISLLSADIPLANDDLVSWSGAGVFAVDSNSLNAGSFTFANYGDGGIPVNSPFGSLDLSLAVQAVPEPTSCGLAALAGAALTARRRRSYGGDPVSPCGRGSARKATSCPWVRI